jgi:hypothetical protein
MATAAPPSSVWTRPDRLGRPDVRARLEAWTVDPPEAPFSFARQLAHDQGWSAGHTARVITEYRRFLSLAVAASHPVCPPWAIDQAWHQHLLDTPAYWLDFCPKVLGQPLHHVPSQGRPGEQILLRQWYELTLSSYRTAFGEDPPADLWPPSQRRFGGVEERSTLRRGLARLGVAPLLVILALGLSGCGISALPFPLALQGPEFLLVDGLLTAVSLAWVHWLAQRRQGKARLGGGLVIGAVWFLGLARLIHGLAAGRPVGFLLLASLLVGLALLQVVSTGGLVGGSQEARGDGGGCGGCGG